MCQAGWSSGQWEMGGLDRHCPAWDVQMSAFRVKASLWRVNPQRLEKLLGIKKLSECFWTGNCSFSLEMLDFDTRQSLTADTRQPALPHASGTSSPPWELEPEETAADTFSEFISGVSGGPCVGRQKK